MSIEQRAGQRRRAAAATRGFTDAAGGAIARLLAAQEAAGMISRLEQGSLVTVFGGSGFVGRHAVRALAPTAGAYAPPCAGPILPGTCSRWARSGQIHAVQANVRFPDSVRRAVEGADAVVNLVGILAKSGRQTFQAVHVAGARAVAEAARAAGAKTLVHVSAIGADKRVARPAMRAPRPRARRPCCEEFPDAVILRPSLVFGPEDQLFNRFAALARLLAVPAADRRRQDQVPAGLRRRRGRGDRSGLRRQGQAAHDLRAGRAGGRHLPPAARPDHGVVGAASASICASPSGSPSSARFSPLPLPNSMRPLTVDQVRMLQSDNVVSKAAEAEGRTLAGLGIEHPHTMAAVVPGLSRALSAARPVCALSGMRPRARPRYCCSR